jgi:hypothetical protein
MPDGGFVCLRRLLTGVKVLTVLRHRRLNVIVEEALIARTHETQD